MPFPCALYAESSAGPRWLAAHRGAIPDRRQRHPAVAPKDCARAKDIPSKSAQLRHQRFRNRALLEDPSNTPSRILPSANLIEARTEAESILTATAKALGKSQVAGLSAEEGVKIAAGVAALQEAAAGSDYKLIRKRIDELNHATEHLAEC